MQMIANFMLFVVGVMAIITFYHLWATRGKKGK